MVLVIIQILMFGIIDMTCELTGNRILIFHWACRMAMLGQKTSISLESLGILRMGGCIDITKAECDGKTFFFNHILIQVIQVTQVAQLEI